MAVAVVDVLEPVEVGHDDSERAAEALDAGELVGERLLALTPVRKAGKAVDESLPLDDAVQAGVVQRHDRLGGKRHGRHPVLLLEVVAEQDQRSEVRRPGLERHLDALSALVRIAGLHELPGRADEDSAGRAGRLDRRLDHETHQLVGVVCGPQGLTKPGDDVAQAATLGFELVEPRLKLVGHLVERSAQESELVAALDGNALLEVAARDRPGRVDEPADRPDDRAALDVGDAGNEEERGDEPDEQPGRRGAVCRIDLRLRADDADGRRAALLECVGDEHPVPGACDRDGPCLAGQNAERTTHARGPGDDPPVLDEDDVVPLGQAGPVLEPADERPIERHRGDDCAPSASPGPTTATCLVDAACGRRPTLNPSVPSTDRCGRERSIRSSVRRSWRKSARWNEGFLASRAAAPSAAPSSS